MIDLLKRHEIQVLRRADHTWSEIAALSGVSEKTTRRIGTEDPVDAAVSTHGRSSGWMASRVAHCLSSASVLSKHSITWSIHEFELTVRGQREHGNVVDDVVEISLAGARAFVGTRVGVVVAACLIGVDSVGEWWSQRQRTPFKR